MFRMIIMFSTLLFLSIRCHAFAPFEHSLALEDFLSVAKSVTKDVKTLKSVYEESKRQGVDPFFITAVISRESGFNKNSVSEKNARGLMQLTHHPVSDFIEEFGKPKEEIDVFSVNTNLKIGIWYLKKLIVESDFILTALAKYQGGPAYAERLRKKGRLFNAYSGDIIISYNNLLIEWKRMKAE